MRNNIVHPGADELKYEIRGIVTVANKLAKEGKEINWENIGDPIAKGHSLPVWMKEIVKKESEDDLSFGYCPTRGIDSTREFLANLTNSRNGAQISIEDILFFNGLGDAISTFYNLLRSEVRVIGPAPAYSTHSSAEGAHAGLAHITYDLDPENNWQPDLEELYNKVKFNQQISGILLINPDNPTGAVFSKEVLERIVEIAEEFDLFVVCDEIYSHTVYGGQTQTYLSEVIGKRPGLAMKGISKEFPWPGSRCGWIEFYNTDEDENFARFVKSLNDAKMLEVCSTTLPQKVLPKIMSHENYISYHEERNQFFERRSEEVYEIFSGIPGVLVNKTNGAFYFSLVFRDELVAQERQISLDPRFLEIIRPEMKGASFDKKFVLQCLAKTGICTVPLSSFNTRLQGFRMTLLEKDDDKFTSTCLELKGFLEGYLGL